MAVEILGRALHHQVDAQCQRLLIHRAGKGVVDDRQDAVRAARAAQPLDVDAPQRRIDRRLEPHHAGAVGKEAVGAGELVE